MNLPALVIQTSGEIISSNLPEFREAVREALANINTELETDEDFGRATQEVSALKLAESAIADYRKSIFSKPLQELDSALAEAAEEIRQIRLSHERQIASKTESVKKSIIDEALARYDIDPLDAWKTYGSGLQNAIKGKRTIARMRAACDAFQEQTQAKINQCREIISVHRESHGTALTHDWKRLEIGDPDFVRAELERRVEREAEAAKRAELEREATRLRNLAAATEKQEAAPTPAPTSEPTRYVDPHSPTNSREDEAERFLGELTAAFSAVKSARQALKVQQNIKAAQRFADAITGPFRQLREDLK